MVVSVRILTIPVNDSVPSEGSQPQAVDLGNVDHRCTALPVGGVAGEFEQPFELEVAVLTTGEREGAV